MPMRFRPPISPRERILLIGVGGVGKSKALLDLARKCPHDTFYLWDNDFSAEVLLSTSHADIAARDAVNVPDPDLGTAWGNVIIRDGSTGDWQELLDWLALVRKYRVPDDWVSIDSFTPTWGAVQGWFTEQVFGSDTAAYFLEVRQEKEAIKAAARTKGDVPKTLGALDGWMDWPVINKEYDRLYLALLNVGCHWLITAEQDRISTDDDKDVKTLFGPYGVKPKGQKSLGHKPRSVFILTKSRMGEYAITTVKDRGREEQGFGMEDAPMEDIVETYLKPVGWKMTKVDA